MGRVLTQYLCRWFLFCIYARGPHQENIVSEDFMPALLKDGKWSVSETLGQTLNTFGNEGAQCLSSDGKILFFTACDREDGFGRCDIYVSFLGAKGLEYCAKYRSFY